MCMKPYALNIRSLNDEHKQAETDRKLEYMRAFEQRIQQRRIAALLLLLLGMGMLACAGAESGPQTGAEEMVASFSGADLLGIRRENGEIYIKCVSKNAIIEERGGTVCMVSVC